MITASPPRPTVPDTVQDVAAALGVEAEALAPHDLLLEAVREAARLGAADAHEAAREGDLVRQALGPNALIPYAAFLKANGISYDTAARLRQEGRLKVVAVGADGSKNPKLYVRAGHAEEFVRRLPLAD